MRQRATHGLEYLASYTLGKANANQLGYYGSGGFTASEGTYWMNAYDPEANYGPAFFDVRHNFVLSASYALPYGRDTAGTSGARAVLGGWVVAGIFQARSGFPISVLDGRGSSLQAVRGGERPNCVGNPEPSNQTLDHWLDINAFARAANGTWGNCGVGIARAPGYQNLDTTLSKRFAIGGPRYAEIRAEMFNLLNRPNFRAPARDINAPNTFGQITSTLSTTTVSTARTGELVLKFFF